MKLIVLGYVVVDPNDRYMVWSPQMGFHFKRPHEITPHLFTSAEQAEHHNQECGSGIGEVKPVYITVEVAA